MTNSTPLPDKIENKKIVLTLNKNEIDLVMASIISNKRKARELGLTPLVEYLNQLQAKIGKQSK